MNKKFNIEDCISIATERGGMCLSKKYISISKKLKWRCGCGYVWVAIFDNIKSGTWCPKCAKNIPLTLKEVCQIAIEKDGKCLSNKYVNNNTNLLWECKNSHVWKDTFTHIREGRWCTKCNRAIRLEQYSKNELKIACRLAEENGGLCLSSEYKNSKTSMLWKCKNNHIWKSVLSSVKQGHWCHKCSIIVKATKKKEKNYKSIYKIMVEKNGKSLSNKYVNSNTYMLWECENGHIWSAKFSYIKSGSWCPRCSVGKTQKKLTNILEDIFPDCKIYSNYKGFQWLKVSKYGKQEIDIYIPELKLAVEYDGEQHFMPVRWGGISLKRATEKLKRVKQLDKIKNAKVKEHQNDVRYFVRFNYNENINKEYVVEKLIEIGAIKKKFKELL